MKNILLSSILILFASAGIVSAANVAETIPEDVTSDMYFHDEVYLRDLTYPEDLTAEEGESTAAVTGVGTVVVGDQQLGGFPRLIVPGETVVTSKRTFSGELAIWWDGLLAVPKKTQQPSATKVGFVNFGAHRGSDITVLGAYQMGKSNEWFSFSNDVHVIFDLKIKDGVKVWMAKDVDSSENNLLFEAEDEAFCVVKDGLCTIKLSESVNKMVLINKAYSKCPPERIENGGYGILPECPVVCDQGFVLDYTDLSCVRAESLDPEEEAFREEFGQRISDVTRARQGYFRYRDTRGSQLESTISSRGLSGDDKKFVDKKNATARANLSSGEKTLWNAIQNVKYDLWRELNREGANGAVDTYSGGASNGESSVEGEIEGELNGGEGDNGAAFGGMLPSTGPGMFIALAMAGIALMAFGATRKR